MTLSVVKRLKFYILKSHPVSPGVKSILLFYTPADIVLSGLHV